MVWFKIAETPIKNPQLLTIFCYAYGVQVDFEESSVQQRFCVKPHIDEELDKRMYERLHHHYIVLITPTLCVTELLLPAQ